MPSARSGTLRAKPVPVLGKAACHYRMTPERALKMPDWPARMGEDMAALYLGVSASTLRAGAAAGRYPKPVRDGKRVLYARCQLDRFVRAQFGLPATDSEGEGRGWAA